MSSAPFPARDIMEACRAAAEEMKSRDQPGSSSTPGGLAQIEALQTLAEKVIEHANQDLHATVSVSADDLILIARHLTFEGPMPLAAALS